MVKIKDVRSANDKLFHDDQTFVAVFVGASMGLGEYFAVELARAFGNGGQRGAALHVILAGRTESKVEQVIASCKTLAPEGHFTFVSIADAALIKEVDRTSEEIVRVLAISDLHHIDLLVQTQTRTDLSGVRKETEEGLDRSMALLCYSRLRFAQNLVTYLRASPRPSHVISVYAAGIEDKIDRDDLSQRKKYGFSNSRTHCIAMKTIVFEDMARENAGKVAFVHYFPGVVITPGYYDKGHPLWFKVVWFLFGPLVSLTVATSPEDSGQRMLFLASSRFPPADGNGAAKGTQGTDGRPNSGAYSVHVDDEIVPPVKLAKFYDPLRADGTDEAIRKHVQAVFDTVSSGRKFTA